MGDFQISLSGEVVARILAFRNFVCREAGMKVSWNAVVNRLLLLYTENQELKTMLKNKDSKIEAHHTKVEYYLELALSQPKISQLGMQTTNMLVPPPNIPKPPLIQLVSDSTPPKPPIVLEISPKDKNNMVKELSAHIQTLKEGEPLLPSMVLKNPAKLVIKEEKEEKPTSS